MCGSATQYVTHLTYKRGALAAIGAVMVLLNGGAAEAQELQAGDVLEPAVTFLAAAPAIDGVLDDHLAHLPQREFSVVEKEDSDNPSIPASYRLAYGADFLYVYVEAEAERLLFRDRAYQNGDGFAMVLGVPRPNDKPTDEFYVLAASAVREQRLEWSRRIFWYYNVDNIFQRTSDDAKLEFNEGSGIISFELYLPWQDVHPYHPWLSDGIGFNLRFVKGTENGSRNRYSVATGRIGAENQPREYVRLTFEEPTVPDGASQTFLLLDRNNIGAGESLGARIATNAGATLTENVRVLIRTGEGTAVASARLQLECDPGVSVHEVDVPTEDLPPGGYRVEWSSGANDSRGEGGLTVLPEVDPAGLRDQLAMVRGAISDGSYASIEFMIQEAEEELATVKPYETAAGQRLQFARVLKVLEAARAGEDAVSEQRGFVRRAYRSELDSTLQPYVVWIPEDLDPQRTYPLLVYLHGSASTERDIMGSRSVIPDGFIALGPKGRGPSNAWSWDHAQEDVAEAMAAVIENYPVDEDGIVLSGFSMGGYGVYRTYYETPEKFRALVVLSGAPNMANRYSGTSDFPDFNEEQYQRAFEAVPIFVFHGRQDRNVSFDATGSLVEQLRAIGADVEFHVEDDKGHSFPNAETVAALHAWLAVKLGL